MNDQTFAINLTPFMFQSYHEMVVKSAMIVVHVLIPAKILTVENVTNQKVWNVFLHKGHYKIVLQNVSSGFHHHHF